MREIVLDSILESASRNPDNIALADSLDSFLTYGRLAACIRACARKFLDCGIKKGDRILIRGVSKKEYVISYFASHMIGAVAVPYEKKIDREALHYLIGCTGARLLVTDAVEQDVRVDTLDMCEICDVPDSYDGGLLAAEADTADLLFTTGTTGNPKGVIMTHRNIFLGAQNVSHGVEMTAQDVTMIVASMNHAYAMGGLRAAMISGAAVVLHENCTVLREMVDKLNQYHCTGFSSVPATIKLLYQYTRGALDRVLGEVRYVELGSSSLDAHMKKELLRVLPDASIYLNYGSTEAPRNIYMDLRKYPDKVTTIGKAAVNATVSIVDEQGSRLPAGEEQVGRLVIEGDMVTPGYWQAEKESRQVLKGNRFFTNDVGYMDEEGFVYLLGRKNDLLNIGGELVSPVEIESAANQCAGVEASACIAIQDEGALLGEKIVLFVQCHVPQSDEVKREIMEYLQNHLENRKIPNEIKFIDQMPVNYVGKLDRKKLYELI